MAVVVCMTMFVTVLVTVMMFVMVFVGVGADFHIATAIAAAAFLTHNYEISTSAISSSWPRRNSPLTLWHRGHSLKKSTHSNSV